MHDEAVTGRLVDVLEGRLDAGDGSAASPDPGNFPPSGEKGWGVAHFPPSGEKGWGPSA